MKRVLTFDPALIKDLEVIQMENTGEYRLKIKQDGAINTVPVSEDFVDNLRDLVEMDQEYRTGTFTFKGPNFNGFGGDK